MILQPKRRKFFRPSRLSFGGGIRDFPTPNDSLRTDSERRRRQLSPDRMAEHTMQNNKWSSALVVSLALMAGGMCCWQMQRWHAAKRERDATERAKTEAMMRLRDLERRNAAPRIE